MNWSDLKSMSVVAALACIIVLVAMVIDLCAGLRKAKLRGEYRSSRGLKLTLSKFIMYEGGMIIALGIDILLNFSKLFELLRLNLLMGVPVVTCLAGVYLLVVEAISVRETSDKKAKKNFAEATEMISKLLESKTFRDVMSAAITSQDAKRKEDPEDQDFTE